MRTRNLVFNCLIVLSTFAFSAYADSNYVPKANEEIYGTWTNTAMQRQKNVSVADGSRDYLTVADKLPVIESKAQLASKWMDSDGNVWYKRFGTVISGEYKGAKWQSLEKISKTGKVREFVSRVVDDFAPGNYPTSIDPNDHDYCIYYRSGK